MLSRSPSSTPLVFLLGAYLGACASQNASSPGVDSPKLAAPESAPRLVILQAGDLHGYLRAEDGQGGYARVAAYVKAEKAAANSTTDVLFVYGGDAADKGALPCRKTRDRACFPLLKQLGIDVAVVGNHELGRPGSETAGLLALSGVPWTSANLMSIMGMQPGFTNDFVYKGPRSGLELAVWGWSSGKAGSGLSLRETPREDDYRKLASYAASGRPLLVVTHQDYSDDKALLGEICKRSIKTLALLKAHNHQTRAETDACAPLFEAGPFGEQINRLVFAKTGPSPLDWKLESQQFVKMDSSKIEDPAIVAEVARLYSENAPEADQVVLEVTQARDDAGAAAFLADAYRNTTHVDLAIVNRGSAKDGFKAGPLTRERLLQTIPYENDLSGLDWNLKDLEKSLCKASMRTPDARLDEGAELVFSGGKLVGGGTPQCRLETARRGGSLKVGIDGWVLAHSERWLGKDLRKNAGTFRFQVSTEQALNRYLQQLHGKL